VRAAWPDANIDKVGGFVHTARCVFARQPQLRVSSPRHVAGLTEETAMFAIVAAILFAVALILALIGYILGPLNVITFISAGLLCLALHLAGIGAGTRTWRRTRV
jgi:hypothetical protein